MNFYSIEDNKSGEISISKSGIYQASNNYNERLNSEKKLNSRVVNILESTKVKNYVYRLIYQKKYKKLLTLKEIYKFSDIE